MNNETLRLSLIETFAKVSPIVVPPSDDIYKEVEAVFEPTLMESLTQAIENSNAIFELTFASINYKLKTTIPFSQREIHWETYVPRIQHKLLQMGVPFVCSTTYYKPSSNYKPISFKFFVEDLKEFCDAEKMGILL